MERFATKGTFRVSMIIMNSFEKSNLKYSRQRIIALGLSLRVCSAWCDQRASRIFDQYGLNTPLRPPLWCQLGRLQQTPL